jgi:D-alanyl-D-alanine dipeptidase
MSYKDYKIKISDWNQSAADYHGVPINQNDPRCSEPLVRLDHFGVAGESFYARDDGTNWPYNQRIKGSLKHLWVRRSIAEKLDKVNDRLRALGLELYVWDAYRPISCQKGLWSFFDQQVRHSLPEASKSERREHVVKYVSDPSRFDPKDPSTWPVHACSGAVDLTLRHIDTGQLLDMGAGFDEMEIKSHSDYFERLLLEGRVNDDNNILHNRRILHWSMEEEGFINYPLEFWHFDWGDQMFVHFRDDITRFSFGAAWHGFIEPPGKLKA